VYRAVFDTAFLRLPGIRAKMESVAENGAADKPIQTFESCLEELEKVVKELETGDLPLERSLELFEKGVGLSESCRKQLEDAETRIETLMRKDGKLQPEPFRPA
jgi:exodeoxyribonuclease VII small subunit